MEADTQGNALTEVALALAMAFFTLLVLAVVGMGVPKADGQKDKQSTAIDAVSIASPAKPDMPAKFSDGDGATAVKTSDQFIIFHQGSYFSADLKRQRLAELAATDGRLILAVSPRLRAEDLVAARSSIDHNNLIVTTYDDRWKKRLENLK